MSKGAKEKVVVEVKLSSNSKLLDGFENQVEIYKTSERAKKAYYLVLQVSDHPDRIQALYDLKNQMAGEGHVTPEIVFVDGMPKQSASKVRSKRK